jgi:hypothetical protein
VFECVEDGEGGAVNPDVAEEEVDVVSFPVELGDTVGSQNKRADVEDAFGDPSVPGYDKGCVIANS